MFHVFLN
jgi:hypothetical protein